MTTSPDDGRPTPKWEFLAAFADFDVDAVESGRIKLRFDAALAAAARALDTGIGLEDALGQVERQIALAAAAQRWFFLDAVQHVEADREFAPAHLRAGLCDLHLMAFELEQRLGHRERARQHLIRAVATGAPHGLPRRHLVGLYIETGEYRAAVDTLTWTVDDERGNTTWRAMALAQLGDELASLSPEQSKLCFERARERDSDGVVGVLADYRLRAVDGMKPSDDVIAARLETGQKLYFDGRREAAIDHLVSALAWHLFSPRAWAGLFVAYRAVIPDFPYFEALSDAERSDLLKAVQAMRMVADLVPDQHRAHYEIALLELTLGHTVAALTAMDRYRALRPDDVTALAYTGMIHFRKGDLHAAASAAGEALEREPENSIANEMMIAFQRLALRNLKERL